MTDERPDLTFAEKAVQVFFAKLNSALGQGEDLDAASWLDVRALVGMAVDEFNAAAREIDGRVGLNSGKARLRQYLLDHVGEVVTNDRLAGVAGTHEWARRMRELELEEGWSITAGPKGGLRPGTYRLEAEGIDEAKASRWQVRNTIRRQEGSGGSRLLAYLKAVFPEAASKEDLAYVARIGEWPRRMRELEEAGWDVVSSVDDPRLPAGSYRLGSLEQGPPRQREAIKLRFELLERDGRACRDCGSSPESVPGTILQIHHLHQVKDGGDNDRDNLVTLCRACHAGRHSVKLDDLSRVRDDLLDPQSDLGA